MGLIALDCTKCGASLAVDDDTSVYTCKYCGTAHARQQSSAATPPYSLRVMAERSIANGEYGKAMQFIERGLVIAPHDVELLALETKAREGLASLAESHSSQTAPEVEQSAKLDEAEQSQLQAQLILNELQANKQVYGSNSALSGATPANVDLGLQYIDRSLELFPNNAVYLNLKALLLWEGQGNKEAASALLQKAAALSPRDINIQNNLKALKSSPCFIATAAFGTPLALEVDVLRTWRDQRLVASSWGRHSVSVYYRISPPIANFIATKPALKYVTRWLLTPLVKHVAFRYRMDDVRNADRAA